MPKALGVEYLACMRASTIDLQLIDNDSQLSRITRHFINADNGNVSRLCVETCKHSDLTFTLESSQSGMVNHWLACHQYNLWHRTQYCGYDCDHITMIIKGQRVCDISRIAGALRLRCMYLDCGNSLPSGQL